MKRRIAAGPILLAVIASLAVAVWWLLTTSAPEPRSASPQEHAAASARLPEIPADFTRGGEATAARDSLDADTTSGGSRPDVATTVPGWLPDQVASRVLETLDLFTRPDPDIRNVLALVEDVARHAPAPRDESTVHDGFRWWVLAGEGATRIEVGRGAVDGDPAYRMRIRLDCAAPMRPPFDPTQSGIEVTTVRRPDGVVMLGEVMNRMPLNRETFRQVRANLLPITLGCRFRADDGGAVGLQSCTARTAGGEGGFLEVGDRAALPADVRAEHITIHYPQTSNEQYASTMKGAVPEGSATRLLGLLRGRLPGAD